MIITYQGGNYFKIQSGELALLIDPENQRSFRGTQVIINTTRPAHTTPADGDNEGIRPFWIDTAGEYEVQGIRIQGFTSSHNATEKTHHAVFRILFDEIVIVVLGHLEEDLSPAIISELSDADIMIVPAGGKPYVAQSALAKIIRQIEPGIVIPSLYKDVKPFLKEVDQTDVKPEGKLVIKKKDIAPKQMKVHVLSQ